MEDSDLDKSNHGFPHPTQQTLNDINLMEIRDDIHSSPNYHQHHRAAYLIRDEDDHNNNSHHRGLRRKGSFIGRHHSTTKVTQQQQQFLQQSSFFLDNDCVPRSGFTPKTVLQEMIAGMVVALATIPTSISYAAVVGISPTMGIWNSAILGLSSSVIGGAPGMITGAAGAAALPMSHIYKTHGLPWMTAAVLTASFIELIFGFSKLSRVADVVTEPVVTGFFNALSMFIFRSQVRHTLLNLIYLSLSLYCSFY
jgi:hypothetical protein